MTPCFNTMPISCRLPTTYRYKDIMHSTCLHVLYCTLSYPTGEETSIAEPDLLSAMLRQKKTKIEWAVQAMCECRQVLDLIAEQIHQATLRNLLVCCSNQRRYMYIRMILRSIRSLHALTAKTTSLTSLRMGWSADGSPLPRHFRARTSGWARRPCATGAMSGIGSTRHKPRSLTVAACCSRSFCT